MGQTTDQIENQIDQERKDLKSNLEELETRVKSATDWRHYFKTHTGAALAVALGGGMLLSAMTRQRSGTSSGRASSGGIRAATTGPKREVLKTFDTITSALVGAAATKFKGVLSEAVPGFADQLARHEDGRGRDSTH